jgi:hypothetical protein
LGTELASVGSIALSFFFFQVTTFSHSDFLIKTIYYFILETGSATWIRT